MTARRGAQYIDGLKDDRVVYLGSRRVDVTTEPAFAGSIRGMAGYFDWQHDHASDCLVKDLDTGTPMSASLIVPRNADDLQARHRCFERLAEYSRGMLGRTPDYCNASLSGQVARADIWHRGDPQRFSNVQSFHRQVIEGDLALTHTLVNPSIDRSAGDLAGVNRDLALRVVQRGEHGITVRGGKLLATLGPFADEIFVYPAAPLPTGQEDFAVSFAIPVGTPGVIQLARDHYGVDNSIADSPFSSRFDEQDSFVIFDDVEVPWERVFIDGDLAVYNTITPAVFPGCVAQQTAIRALVKLKFAYDLCVQMAKIQNAESNPDVARMLGELYGYIALTRSTIVAAEARAYDWGAGAFFPHADLAILRTFMPEWMMRVSEIIELIGSHHLLTTPSSGLFDDPTVAPLLDAFLPSADGRTARERAQVFRTAWDFNGSALGSRVKLYERYYLASRNRNLAADHLFGQASQRWSELDEFVNSSRKSGT
ncbi:MAG: 4-hydroxyphenylacetate 3-hydroxylase N-terminal domain-containing protein [Ilumatobacteraceae bacterium]